MKSISDEAVQNLLTNLSGDNMKTTQVQAVQTAWIYLTVQQFTKRHPAFTTGGLRSLIFNEHSNGLAESGAVVRIGRKVLIDESKFFGWVSAQNQRTSA